MTLSGLRTLPRLRQIDRTVAQSPCYPVLRKVVIVELHNIQCFCNFCYVEQLRRRKFHLRWQLEMYFDDMPLADSVLGVNQRTFHALFC